MVFAPLGRADATVKIATFVLLACLLAQVSSAQGLSAYDIIDLSHAYGEDTLYWPNAKF